MRSTTNDRETCHIRRGVYEILQTHQKISEIEAENSENLPRLWGTTEKFLAKESSYDSNERTKLLDGISNVEKYIRDAARLVNSVVSQVQGAAHSISSSIGNNVKLTYELRKLLVSSTLARITNDIARCAKLLFVVNLAKESSSSRIQDLINAQNQVIEDAQPWFKVIFIELGGDRNAIRQAQQLKKDHQSELDEMFRVTKALADYLVSVRERCKGIKAECEAELTTLGFAEGKVINAKTYFQSTIDIEREAMKNGEDMIEVSNILVKTLQQLRSQLDKAYGEISPSRHTRSITDRSTPRIIDGDVSKAINSTAMSVLVNAKSRDSCCSIFLADASGVLSYECEHPHENRLCFSLNITHLIRNFEKEFEELLVSLKSSRRNCSNEFYEVFDCYQFLTAVNLKHSCKFLPERNQTNDVAPRVERWSITGWFGESKSTTSRSVERKTVVKYIAP
ncbi:hypothetical protein QAD02_011276 [Eretmocerus hayati]|uniref:Uncharacterized protein n=1 Tax=Eretmocerus hayati TaxID=131215 RepID=A0ACC2NW16_9HYME|nr:hypothetical protein QAD02_011276 [Eretmocerus hayati]